MADPFFSSIVLISFLSLYYGNLQLIFDENNKLMSMLLTR